MYYFKKFAFLIVFIGFSSVQAGSYEDFFEAIRRDKSDELQDILNRGFDPNSVNANGQYALMLSLLQGHFAAAQTLISEPTTLIDVRNEKDESPLMLAALKGRLDLCEQLIARGADVNKPGWTPLHYASTRGDVAIIQLLLDQFAYIDAESPNGTTPLMMAAQYGTIDAVKLLIDAGADVTIKNALGLTALDFAKKSKKATVIDLIASAMRSEKSKGGW